MATLDPNTAFRALYRDLSRNTELLRKLQSLDPSTPDAQAMMLRVLKNYGLEGNADNFNDLLTTVKMFDTEDEIKQGQEKAEFEQKKKSDQVKQEYSDAVRRIMMTDPTTRGIYAALIAASEGTHAAANISRNNGNRLAQALLSSKRGSDRQRERYGQSYSDIGKNVVAADTQRRGENAGAVFDALGNAIDRALGMQRQEDTTVRQLEMTPYNAALGMSGTYWQTLGQREKRAYNSIK